MSINSAARTDIAVVIAESLLYGMLVVLYFWTIRVRAQIRARREAEERRTGTGTVGERDAAGWWRPWFCFVRVPIPVLVPTTALICIATAHWIITIFQAFCALDRELDMDPVHIFSRQHTVLQEIGNLLAPLTVIIGDGVILHRLWVIWDHDRRVVIPGVSLWLGQLVSGVAVEYIIFRNLLSPEGLNNAVEYGLVQGWVTGQFSITAALNIYCSSFISWRVWKVSSRHSGDPFLDILQVLVESAALYTIWIMIFIVAYYTNQALAFVSETLTVVVVALTNVLIFLRLGLVSGSDTSEELVITACDSILEAERQVETIEVHPSLMNPTLSFSDSHDSDQWEAEGLGKDVDSRREDDRSGLQFAEYSPRTVQ
ncbi:unnamed protein product [Mycena citricolor]|uniref:Uncharacterized protein n=1 Tax=Mycena citricolor TaxID=2018698 RepID=A0AAD2JYW9_9AGAR|nr:unnamed protein product [Mycena citricolor]